MNIATKLISEDQVFNFETINLSVQDVKDLFDELVVHAFEIDELNDKNMDIALIVEQLAITILSMDMKQDSKKMLNDLVDDLFTTQQEWVEFLKENKYV